MKIGAGAVLAAPYFGPGWGFGSDMAGHQQRGQHAERQDGQG